MDYEVALDTVSTETLDVLFSTPFSEYSRTELFLLLIVLLLVAAVFMMMWRRK